MLKYIAISLCLFAACTPAQRTAEVAKAKACVERPEVKACQDRALADCVVNDTCESKEAPRALLECLKLCASAADSGAAGAGE
jgi:hypothetical protein